MPPRKSAKSNKGEDGVRKSPRKRNVPEKAIETTPVETPKRTRRRAKKTKSDEEQLQTPKLDFSDCVIPSTSSGGENDNNNVCAFYRVKVDENGKRTFNKALIKYFMTIDSPEMEDLRKKRFNTSFKREGGCFPRSRDFKIFTEQEDEDEKWLANVPKLKFDMPSTPGSGHATVFESMPIGGDSDEELKPQSANKRRKSTRCTEFKGKPLPEQSLAVDYTGVFDSESSHDDASDDLDKEKETEMEEKERVLHEAVSKNKNSILLSLLSAPSDGLMPYKYTNLHPSYSYNLANAKEDEILLNKYRDVMGNKRVNVVLTRLPIDTQLLELNKKKKSNLKSTIDFQRKRKVSEVKKTVAKKARVPRLGSSKLQRKKQENSKP